MKQLQVDDVLNKTERDGILAIAAYNELERGYRGEFDKRWQVGRLKIRAKHRSRKRPMGRFGGGWNWGLGIQCGRTCAIINLLVMYVRISWK